MEIEIRTNYKVGVYVSSYELSKALGKKHQNFMTSVKRKYKGYIHYEKQDHRYYKGQIIYYITRPILRKINKNGEFNLLLEEMQTKSEEIEKRIFEGIKQLFG